MHRIARSFAELLAKAGLLILLTFAVMTVADGLARAFASQPIDAVRDLAGGFISVSITACFPYAFLQRSNITVDILSAVLWPKLNSAIDIAAAVVSLVVLVFFAWQYFLNASKVLAAGEVTLMLNFPRAIFWFAVDVMMWLAVVAQLLIIFEEIGSRFGRKPLQESSASSIS